MEQDINVRLAAAGMTLAVDALAGQVFRAFRDEGLECRLLKGASFASWLYDDGDIRTYVDCDFLVPPGDFDAAEAVLRRLGFFPLVPQYVPGDRPSHHAIWVQEGTNQLVELHRTLVGATESSEVVWKVLSEPAQSVVVLDQPIDALAVPARALHVALHLAQHGPTHLKCREDLFRALQRLSLADWAAAGVLAEAIGATQAFSLGLRCDPVGAEVASRLGLPDDVSTEMQIRVSGDPPLALGFEWLSSKPGVTSRAVFVVRKSFPPPSILRGWIALKRGRLLPLPLAYLWRLAWLFRHAPAGYRAWRKTKRERAK